MTRYAFLTLAALILGLGIGWRSGIKAGARLAPAATVIEIPPASCGDLLGAVADFIGPGRDYPQLIPLALEAESEREVDHILRRMERARERLERVGPRLNRAAEACAMDRGVEG